MESEFAYIESLLRAAEGRVSQLEVEAPAVVSNLREANQ